MRLPDSLRSRLKRQSNHHVQDVQAQSPQASNEGIAEKKDLAVVLRATKTRRNFIVAACCLYFLAIIFLILVMIGNTHNTPVLRRIYFYKLELADIIPISAPNAVLINSIARSLGLHDFYQVGLWNFCEGYNDEGVTFCSTPERFYWFNPVAVLVSELLSGATIALPSAVNSILTVIRIASQVMFGFFLTGLVLSVVLMLSGPLALLTRWWSLPLGSLSFLAALLVGGAAVLGTAMSVVFKVVMSSQQDLNIHAEVGVQMLAFMWIAAAFTAVAFLIHSAMGCCCASRRDIRTGRRNPKPKHLAANEGAEKTTGSAVESATGSK